MSCVPDCERCPCPRRPMTAWPALDAALVPLDLAPLERMWGNWRPLLEVLIDGPYSEDCDWTFDRRCPVVNS